MSKGRSGSFFLGLVVAVGLVVVFGMSSIVGVITYKPPSSNSQGCFIDLPGDRSDVPFFAIDGGSDAEDFFNQFSEAEKAEMKQNATTIIQVGRSRPGITRRDLDIAIATAIQESNLQNLNHGHLNSHGLFQQQWDQGWGTIAQTMDPVYASNKFYEVLETIENREAPRPMIEVAMAVQRPDPIAYYDRWDWDIIAPQIVAAHGGDDTKSEPEIVLAAADQDCTKPTLAVDAAALRGTGSITGPYVKGDDYPYASWIIDSITPTGLARECVDFVQWRLNEQSGTPNKFKNVGHAFEWGPKMAARGYPIDDTPAIGAVAWFDSFGGDPTVAKAREYGHVAIVSGVNIEKGTVILEHYNGMDWPNNHRYSVVEAPINMPRVRYIHVADIPVLTPAMAVSHG